MVDVRRASSEKDKAIDFWEFDESIQLERERKKKPNHVQVRGRNMLQMAPVSEFSLCIGDKSSNVH